MGEGERETCTTDEFGTSHEGAVGALLTDGSVPAPVFFDMGSGRSGKRCRGGAPTVGVQANSDEYLDTARRLRGRRADGKVEEGGWLITEGHSSR
jgi:hypothetical protein